MEKVISILETAKARIADGRWHKGSFTSTYIKYPSLDSDDIETCKMCAFGALAYGALKNGIHMNGWVVSDVNNPSTHYDTACTILKNSAHSFGYCYGPIELNDDDKTELKDVIEMFDRAINMAKNNETI